MQISRFFKISAKATFILISSKPHFFKFIFVDSARPPPRSSPPFELVQIKMYPIRLSTARFLNFNPHLLDDDALSLRSLGPLFRAHNHYGTALWQALHPLCFLLGYTSATCHAQ